MPDPMDRTQALQNDEARRAYEDGGPEELARYLRRLDELFAGRALPDRRRGPRPGQRRRSLGPPGRAITRGRPGARPARWAVMGRRRTTCPAS